MDEGRVRTDMGFFANLFKGSQSSQPEEKKEDKEYIEFLLKELDTLKKETNTSLDRERQTNFDLQSQIEKEKVEKEELQKIISDFQEKEKGQTEENEKKLAELQEQLKNYEGSYSDFSRFMTMAKKEAEQTVAKAKQEAEMAMAKAEMDAEKITTAAKAEALLHQKNVEKELKEQAKANEQKYTIAKYKLMEYLNALNNTQSKLIETYNELGALVQKMPIRIDDLFSDEPLGLLPEEKDKDYKGWTVKDVDESDRKP